MNTTTTTIIARSPVHHHLAALDAQWGAIGDYEIALHVGAASVERANLQTLGLCDLSALPKLGIKGPNAIAWAKQQNINVPEGMFTVGKLDDGSIIARTGGDELFLESGLPIASISTLSDALGNGGSGLYRIDRQDATFLLTGRRVHEVFAQTCGIHMAREGEDKVIYTRVAAASCAILPQTINGQRAYRLWLDYTFADYLWEQLAHITHELAGGVIGAATVYPTIG